MNELAFAWKLTVFGMGVVFFALSLVAGTISLFSRLESLRARRGPAPPAEPEVPPEVPPEVVAAISAALTVAMGRRVRVHRVRYRRGAVEKTWSRQGRISIMASHAVR